MSRSYLDEQLHWRAHHSGRVADTVMPFGQHKGETFRQIASEDSGLLYLDWLIGQAWLKDPLKSRLKTFLDDPYLVRRLNDILET